MTFLIFMVKEKKLSKQQFQEWKGKDNKIGLVLSIKLASFIHYFTSHGNFWLPIKIQLNKLINFFHGLENWVDLSIRYFPEISKGNSVWKGNVNQILNYLQHNRLHLRRFHSHFYDHNVYPFLYIYRRRIEIRHNHSLFLHPNRFTVCVFNFTV